MAQFTDEEAKELKNFLAFLKGENSNVAFVKYLIDDIRDDIITRDELNAAVKNLNASLPPGTELRVVVQ